MDKELRKNLTRISTEIFDVYEEEVFNKDEISLKDIDNFLKQISMGLVLISVPLYGCILKKLIETLDLSESEYSQLKEYTRDNLRQVSDILCDEIFKTIEYCKNLDPKETDE